MPFRQFLYLLLGTILQPVIQASKQLTSANYSLFWDPRLSPSNAFRQLAVHRPGGILASAAYGHNFPSKRRLINVAKHRDAVLTANGTTAVALYRGIRHSLHRRSLDLVLVNSPEHEHALCANKSHDRSVCNRTHGKMCIDGKCTSACSVSKMSTCRCSDENDDYCYLCCGNEYNECKPAHKHGIYKSNGERWERNQCAWCRHKMDQRTGVKCDDEDDQKVCYGEQCVGGICKAAPEGKYCINTNSKKMMCVNDQCEDPCKREKLTMCECHKPSAYRCQLCCYDFRTGKCESAYLRWGLKHSESRPYFRVGLTCGRYDWTCNNIGRCAGCSLLWKTSSSVLSTLAGSLTLCLISYFYFINCTTLLPSIHSYHYS